MSKTDKKSEIIAELQRVATLLEKQTVTISEFEKHGNFSSCKVRSTFGSWNEAIIAANLNPIAPGPVKAPPKISDEELLKEIISLTKKLGKEPSQNEMSAKGKFSDTSYRVRFGSWVKAKQIAYATYGHPLTNSLDQVKENIATAPQNFTRPTVQPETFKPKSTGKGKKAQYGNPMEFRGLRHEPINEQGVVYLFGMVSKELGFLIESIQQGFPDCEGKREVKSSGRWERVLIEFEHRSSNFKDHGHDPEKCDLIVCWEHDWPECPIEVLELRSQIKLLPNK